MCRRCVLCRHCVFTFIYIGADADGADNGEEEEENADDSVDLDSDMFESDDDEVCGLCACILAVFTCMNTLCVNLVCIVLSLTVHFS